MSKNNIGQLKLSQNISKGLKNELSGKNKLMSFNQGYEKQDLDIKKVISEVTRVRKTRGNRYKSNLKFSNPTNKILNVNFPKISNLKNILYFS